MRAAPLPLPSSDSRKFTSHLGARSFTVCWKIREKLRRTEGRGQTTITTCSKIQCVPALPLDSLWVEFVQRAVHAHSDVQVVQPSVLTDFIHHGRHPGTADLGGAAGHGAAHLLDDNTVVAGAVEPQLLQDSPDLQQRQTVAVGEGQRSDNSRSVTGYLTAAPRG